MYSHYIRNTSNNSHLSLLRPSRMTTDSEIAANPICLASGSKWLRSLYGFPPLVDTRQM